MTGMSYYEQYKRLHIIPMITNPSNNLPQNDKVDTKNVQKGRILNYNVSINHNIQNITINSVNNLVRSNNNNFVKTLKDQDHNEQQSEDKVSISKIYHRDYSTIESLKNIPLYNAVQRKDQYNESNQQSTAELDKQIINFPKSSTIQSKSNFGDIVRGDIGLRTKNYNSIIEKGNINPNVFNSALYIDLPFCQKLGNYDLRKFKEDKLEKKLSKTDQKEILINLEKKVPILNIGKMNKKYINMFYLAISFFSLLVFLVILAIGLQIIPDYSNIVSYTVLFLIDFVISFLILYPSIICIDKYYKGKYFKLMEQREDLLDNAIEDLTTRLLIEKKLYFVFTNGANVLRIHNCCDPILEKREILRSIQSFGTSGCRNQLTIGEKSVGRASKRFTSRGSLNSKRCGIVRRKVKDSMFSSNCYSTDNAFTLQSSHNFDKNHIKRDIQEKFSNNEYDNGNESVSIQNPKHQYLSNKVSMNKSVVVKSVVNTEENQLNEDVYRNTQETVRKLHEDPYSNTDQPKPKIAIQRVDSDCGNIQVANTNRLPLFFKRLDTIQERDSTIQDNSHANNKLGQEKNMVTLDGISNDINKSVNGFALTPSGYSYLDKSPFSKRHSTSV